MSEGWQILIPDSPADPDIERKVFGAGSTLHVQSVARASDMDAEAVARAEGILLWHVVSLDQEALARLRNCRIIVRVGTGFDNVDLRAAGERGIAVCNVPDYGTSDVADHAMALLLALARGVNAYSEQVRNSGSWGWNSAGSLHRLAGSTLGIIGLGRIGTAAALRAKAFGMRVVFYDPYISDGYDKALGITRVRELNDLLRESDYVSLHAPLTDETRGMMNADFFKALKPGATLINTARGGMMDLDALHDALRTGTLRAAGLDVLPIEPPPRDHPLIAAWRAREPWVGDRLMITPHAAFYCDESFAEMRRKAAETARDYLEKSVLRNCVNRQFLSKE
jgi:phosphoglycerate dehydrogenase-like enzyme